LDRFRIDRTAKKYFSAANIVTTKLFSKIPHAFSAPSTKPSLAWHTGCSKASRSAGFTTEKNLFPEIGTFPSMKDLTHQSSETSQLFFLG